ncbi:MAG: L,D-transpeptidase family protein [Anaerolineae bacterium]|nr:L,D-transpeptidase family protein [Anaerolineae bacterium]
MQQRYQQQRTIAHQPRANQPAPQPISIGTPPASRQAPSPQPMQQPMQVPPRYAQPQYPPQAPHMQPAPVQAPAPARAVRARSHRSPMFWMMLGLAALTVGSVTTIGAIAAGVMLYMGSGRILPGVSVLGISLGGMSTSDAAAELNRLNEITVQDGERTWKLPASQIGITIDTMATAQNAQQAGRSDGSLLGAFTHTSVAPVINIDSNTASQALHAFAQTADLPAQNATIRLVNGQLTPIAASSGRMMDVDATLNRLLSTTTQELSDGALDLVMTTTQPAITDATPLLEQTRALLASPLTINAYNPITNETQPWALSPDQWGAWLTTTNTATGLALSLDGGSLTNYLTQQNAALGSAHSIKVDEAVKQVQDALAANNPTSTIRVYNPPTEYTVNGGDTLGGIAWKMGIPYWRIEKANPGLNLNMLSAGQSITIPSKDDLLPLPIVPNKRIVVSIAQQRMWVYENGQVKWEWAGSTGIPDSPTVPGVYQVLSHDGTAYAGNWNLNMPSFMSIYEAVPGFSNGIHGFPWRNGHQILWENALGTKVTYGCILLSSTNAEALYNWAEDGVVVEITG